MRDLELVVTWEDYRSDAERLAEVESEHENLRAGLVGVDAKVARAEANLEADRRAHLDREKELQRTSEGLYAIRSEIQALENRVEYESREREGLVRLADEREREIEELATQLGTNQRDLTETL